MPQMAPLMWETLYLLFLLSLTVMSIIIYHNNTQLPKEGSYGDGIKKTEIKWMW